MTNQEYLEALLDGQDVPDQELRVLRTLRERIERRLSPLGGGPRFYYAGSYGKKTMIRQRYDLDVVAYWPRSAGFTVEDLYDEVGRQLRQEFTYVNSKTVCWEIPFQNGFHIDVVPGRALADDFLEANLFRTDKGTTLKTSIK